MPHMLLCINQQYLSDCSCRSGNIPYTVWQHMFGGLPHDRVRVAVKLPDLQSCSFTLTALVSVSAVVLHMSLHVCSQLLVYKCEARRIAETIETPTCCCMLLVQTLMTQTFTVCCIAADIRSLIIHKRNASLMKHYVVQGVACMNRP